jgi:hypothetical protein
VTPTAHPKILAVSRPEVDPAWLEAELDELEHLVGAGETLEVVGRLRTIVRAPRLAGAPASRSPVA